LRKKNKIIGVLTYIAAVTAMVGFSLVVINSSVDLYNTLDNKQEPKETVTTTDNTYKAMLEISDKLDTIINNTTPKPETTKVTEINIKEDMCAEETETEIEIVEDYIPNKNFVPDVPTNWFVCEPMDMITNTRSDQYLLQQKCQTEAETGARYYCYNSIPYYTVAMAANYGREIGDTWYVELDNGESFYIMLGDFKDDGTDITRLGDYAVNYDGECLNIIEFIVERNSVPRNIWKYGSLTRLDRFEGNIVTMQHLGLVDWQGEAK
jgi:hypothetical protein